MTKIARLHALFIYDSRSGFLLRRVNRGKGRAGDVVGTKHSEGYLQVRVDGAREYVHRIAYALMVGTYPEKEIDHINGDRADNRWCNLRGASHAENMQNRPRASHSTQPFKGVRQSPTKGKWTARIGINQKEMYLGTFATAQAANAAYKKAASHFQPFNTAR
jgi:hypothetical protein